MSLSGFNRNRLIYSVDEGFFDKWNPKMAYVLGFTYADGNIYKTSLSWDIQTRDLRLLKRIKKCMNCTYPIHFRPHSVRLRISNQKLIEGIKGKGLINKKALRMRLPQIPSNYVRPFIRGFLEGDGWIVKRSNRNEVDLGFVSGNNAFLQSLSNLIYRYVGISGRVREKNKITSNGIKSRTYLMEYYSNNAIKVANWLYKDILKKDLYLDRKYKKYLISRNLYEYLNSGKNETIRKIQIKFNKQLSEILKELYVEKHLDGVQISKLLGVHSSSIYRWLASTGIKYPVHRD